MREPTTSGNARNPRPTTEIVSDEQAEATANELIGPPVDSPTARAYTQQRIANGIRRWVDECPVSVAELARAIVEDEPGRHHLTTERVLAAAATDDVIWDALAQVRQVIVLTRAPASAIDDVSARDEEVST